MTNERLVFWHGILQKDGERTDCTVQVTEIQNPAGGPPAYVKFVIINVARSLPEGAYELETHGEKLSVRHVNGGWIAA